MNIDERAIFGCHGGGATQNVVIKKLEIHIHQDGAVDAKITRGVVARIVSLITGKRMPPEVIRLEPECLPIQGGRNLAT